MHDRRRWLQGAVAAAGGLLGLPAGAGDERLPALPLPTLHGAPVLAAEPAARLTYIDFWASWCAPCRLSFPWMNRMHTRWAGAGLRIVAVNLDRREADAQRFLQAVPAQFELAMDPQGQLARQLDVQAMPTAFLVGPDRRLLLRHRGFSPEDAPGLEARIRAALGVA